MPAAANPSTRRPRGTAPRDAGVAAADVVPVLRSWDDLNAWLMSVDDESTVRRALAKERRGRNRTAFVRRIYSRLARLRSRRERAAVGYES